MKSWVENEAYYMTIVTDDKESNILDSCGGFFTVEDAEKEALAIIKHYIEKSERQLTFQDLNRCV